MCREASPEPSAEACSSAEVAVCAAPAARATGALDVTVALRDGAFAEGELFHDGDGTGLEWADEAADFSFTASGASGGASGRHAMSKRGSHT